MRAGALPWGALAVVHALAGCEAGAPASVDGGGEAAAGGGPAPATCVPVSPPPAFELLDVAAVSTVDSLPVLRLGADGRSIAQTQLLDFRNVDGVVVPYSVESSTLTENPGGTAAVWTVAVWEKVEFGVTLAATDFEVPGMR